MVSLMNALIFFDSRGMFLHPCAQQNCAKYSNFKSLYIITCNSTQLKHVIDGLNTEETSRTTVIPPYCAGVGMKKFGLKNHVIGEPRNKEAAYI